MCRLTPPLMVLLLMPLAMGTARAADEPAPGPGELPPTPPAVRYLPGATPGPGAVAAVPVPAYVAPRVLPGHGEAPVAMVPVPAGLPPVQAGYPYLNAPLNPCPQPNVPVQVGTTVITNQAFHPQEMLYPHDYEAIYPPYYYRARGWWLATPFGVRSKERWETLGTRVKVKYRSSIPFWAGYHVPNRDYFNYDRNWPNPG